MKSQRNEGCATSGARFGALLVIVFLAALAAPAALEAQPFGGYLLLGGGAAGIRVPHSPALNPTGAFTLEAWVAVGNVPNGTCVNIAGKNYTTGWWVGICDGVLRSYLKGSSSRRNGGQLGGWGWIRFPVHVAVVFDGTNRLHYVDGVQVATFPETGPLTTNSDPLEIGSDVAYEGHSPSGLIDEVRLWNVARSQDQLRGSINVPITSPQPGLVAVWHLDGNGHDDVGGHNGAPFGGAGFSSINIPAGASCIPHAAVLCLQNRFDIMGYWQTATDTGDATVQVRNPGSGIFSFFDPNNWEVMLKVINACGFNSRWWVFTASGTNVFYKLSVYDTVGSAQKIYINWAGPPAPAVTDTDAFATCP